MTTRYAFSGRLQAYLLAAQAAFYAGQVVGHVITRVYRRVSP
jgi:hypothetical protein